MKSTSHNETFTKISEEKRNMILQTAINEFSEHGFQNANINIIAKKSGISIGAMYSYFNSKEALFSTIVNYAVETLKSVLDEIMLSEGDFIVKIEKIIKAAQLNSRTNVLFTKLYGQLTAENRSDLIAQIVSDIESVSAGLYASLLEQAQKENKIRGDIDPRLLAFFLDNLLITLQFSYACTYYQERMKIYIGEENLENESLVADQLFKLIKSAFCLK
jgi:Transcriptional regulator